MNRADRAKQFAPFDALKGLQEALREKEELHERIEKMELSEEEQEKLSLTTSRLRKGMNVEITFFNTGKYYELKGKVNKVDLIYRFLQVGEGKIYFDDIKKLKIIM